MAMKKISLNNLPQHSPWPSRLLDFEKFVTEPRTVKKILREYDTDKYGTFLQYAKKQFRHTEYSIEKFEQRDKASDPIVCISIHSELFVGKRSEAQAIRERKFLTAMKKPMSRCDTVIDLGAGYGSQLALLRTHYPKHMFIGGEISKNGIALSRLFFKKKEIVLHPFNFFDRVWRIFDTTESKRILVLTCHSVEMLPRSALFFQRLSKYKDRIVEVIQFEPLYELAETHTLLGLLRRRYTIRNDYSTDLYSAFQKMGHKIIIRSMDYDFFGGNPLFPEAHIHWQFRKDRS
jgi:hypothetical protein